MSNLHDTILMATPLVGIFVFVIIDDLTFKRAQRRMKRIREKGERCSRCGR